MTDQYRLTVLSKQHQISFPVTRLAPLLDIGRAPIDSHTSLDAIYQAGAFAFTRYSRWRAIHSCRDFADCFPGLAIPGNRATLFQRKLFIFLSHRNTLYKRCCTSFVNLGNLELLRNPGFRLALAIASLAGMTFEIIT